MYVKQLKSDWHIKLVLSVCAFILAFGTLCAQNIKVTGIVVDNNKEPVIGAGVVIKGTRTATSASLDGTFFIDAPANATLVISAIGYTTQEIPVRGRTKLDIILEESAIALEEAVVTAEYGVKRAARAVGSAVQSVRGTDIAQSGRDNFMNALQGRVSGLTVSTTSGSPGASSSVIIRGATSMSGNNQPLFVIDGVPMNNSTFNPDGGFAAAQGKDPAIYDTNMDFANRGADINPEDIESMTVLKGAAAAALYGSAASNGAILITTKKGSVGRGRFSYGNSFRFDQAYRYPEIQTKYNNGQYGGTNYYNQSRWGAPYQSTDVLYNNLENLFQTGFTQKHDLSFEMGTEGVTMRATAGILNSSGVVPTSSLNRTNLTLRGTAKLTKWLSLEGTMEYINSKNVKTRKGDGGILKRAMIWPLTDDMRVYEEAGSIRYPDNYQDVDVLNPYFDLYKNKSVDYLDRMISSLKVLITPVKDLLLTGQVGYDVAQTTTEYVVHPDWSSSATGTGSYDQARNLAKYPTVTLHASYRKDIGKFTGSLAVGYSQREINTSNIAVHGEKFYVRDFQSINNCDPSTYIDQTSNVVYRNQSVFASLELSFNNMLFLTGRANNSWSSSLPKDNNSYFYPGIEGSFIFSELPFMQNLSDVFSYVKFRGSWARVGRDAVAHSIYPALEAAFTNNGGYRYGYTGPNLALKPEMITSWEVGVELRLLRNRIDVDFGYFNIYSADQIVNGFRMSYATGFVLNNLNVGTFRTTGWEGRVAVDALKNRNWTWNIALTADQAWSKVLKLPENVSEYYLSGTWVSGNLRNGIMVGHPVTTITGLDWLRNDKGERLIDPSSGMPVSSGVWSVLGDRRPFMNYGLSSMLRYKGISLRMLLNGMIGGTVVNGTKRWMMSSGQSWESVTLRDGGPIVMKGVLRDGKENSDNPTINTIAVDPIELAGALTNGDADWVEKDVYYLRVSEIGLSYEIPSKWINRVTKKLISSAYLSASVNDLAFITNYSGIDPIGNSNSASMGGSGGVGFDMLGIAAPRGYTFGLKITF